MQRLVAATDNSVAAYTLKHEAFPVACSEPVNCGNVLMLGSGNCILTERQSACVFVIFVVLIVCLSV